MSSLHFEKAYQPHHVYCLQCNLEHVITEQKDICLVLMIPLEEEAPTLHYEWTCALCGITNDNLKDKQYSPTMIDTTKVSLWDLKHFVEAYPNYKILTTRMENGERVVDAQVSKSKEIYPQDVRDYLVAIKEMRPQLVVDCEIAALKRCKDTNKYDNLLAYKIEEVMHVAKQ